MERLQRCFERLRERNELALVLYLTAGDPSPGLTIEAAWRSAEAGADVLELGIPFSDPIADGPTIQAAIDRALKRGVRVATVLEMVRTIRQKSEVPLVLMTYFNPVLRYGLERLAADAAQAGADGVLLTDVPPEEAGEWLAVARERDWRRFSCWRQRALTSASVWSLRSGWASSTASPERASRANGNGCPKICPN